jgi:hypothetical protein
MGSRKTDMDTHTTIAKLVKQKEALVAYQMCKMISGDWQAIQDAASDIREITVKLKILARGAQR